MAFRDPARRIVDEETRDVGVPQREGEAAGAAVLVGEIEAVVVVAAIGRAIEIIEAVVVELPVDGKAAGVIVDDVEHDRDPVDMAEIDQRLQLARRARDILAPQRGVAARRKQRVERGEIAGKIGIGGDIGKIGREQIGPP